MAMYLRHFGLRAEPFSIAPDPRLLFMSERHREALAHLLYGVQGGGGFVVLTGDVGTGKTTVCRCFLEQVPKRCNVAYIFNPAMNVLELLRTVCAEFHVPVHAALPGHAPTRKDHVDALNDYLLRTHAVGQNNVLVIDEAQNLSAAVLEQLRLLTNLETSERKLLQIVLIGQSELRRLLARPELEQLAQRVIARYHLEPLGAAETLQYIAHRLAAAGREGPLPFDRGALARIVHHSRGIPRRINLLADRALLGAFAGGSASVDRRIVDRAAVEVFGADAGARAPAWRRRAWIGAGALAAGVAAAVVVATAWRDAGDSGIVAETVTWPVPGLGLAGAVDGEPMPSPRDDASAAMRRSLARVPADAGFAWQQLAARWGVALGDGDPCAAVASAQLQCHRGSGGVELLRRLDRPAILRLRDGDGPALDALLVALGPSEATLQFADASFDVPLDSLERLWAGDYVTLWRPPAGYRGAALNPADAASARWLGAQLDRWSAPDAAATVRERLRAFQAANGLPPDGLAGALTLMQFNRAAGVDEPRLATD